ncbi:TRAP transporter substrate-binding protein [Kordiimonas laminariae]|uniref:TRAP transporter substrate-binding protein n=1 Tax=Kordiimonas laminariae TaxID=2917717 RepID=UPI001FF362A5|nr:TRAP transporter substrate-binding protein [Kordiimonas laminariae]
MRKKAASEATENKGKATDLGRRALLRGAGVAGAAAVIAACDGGTTTTADGAPAIVSKKRNLKMVTSWPKNFPGLGTGADRLAKRIEALSDGAIKVKLYAAGELVGALECFDAVSQGKADMYHAAEYYWQGKSPAFNFFAAVPMGMTANEMNAWIQFGGGQELWDELSGGFNIKPFAAGNSSTQMGGWFNKDINSIEDFQGLRIRMPGLGGEVMKRIGATPVTKQGGEIFQALSQGNIDATEWVGPWNDLAFGFHTIVKKYYYPGIHEPGTTLSMGLNKELWEDMSPREQEIIRSASMAENDMMHAEFNANNARALNTLINDHGVELKRFDDAILKRLAEVSAEVIADAANTDELSQKVFKSFSESRTSGMQWGEIGEQAFVHARGLLDT